LIDPRDLHDAALETLPSSIASRIFSDSLGYWTLTGLKLEVTSSRFPPWYSNILPYHGGDRVFCGAEFSLSRWLHPIRSDVKPGFPQPIEHPGNNGRIDVPPLELEHGLVAEIRIEPQDFIDLVPGVVLAPVWPWIIASTAWV
jgi:hypothetical protein